MYQVLEGYTQIHAVMHMVYLVITVDATKLSVHPTECSKYIILSYRSITFKIFPNQNDNKSYREKHPIVYY